MESKDKVRFLTSLLGDDNPQCFDLRKYRDDILNDLDRLEKLEKAFKIICEELDINVVDIEGDYKLVVAWCCSDISKRKGKLLSEVLEDVKD